MGKIVIIGLDAGCLDIIVPWMERGKLPHLKGLCDRGVYSELRSTIPPMTPSAWTSLITGKNPGKHGITYEFFKQTDYNQESRILSALDNKAKCIWDYLTEHDMSSIVINVPLTHPAKKIKGILIPGYLAPTRPTCFPQTILDEFEQDNGEYELYCDDRGKSPEETLQDYMHATNLTKMAVLYYTQHYEWDFLMVEFQKTDAIFHIHGGPNQEHLRLQLYQCVDECIGEILGTFGNETTVFLVSDHGMGKCEWECCLNSWLKEENLLVYDRKAIMRSTDTLDTYMSRMIDKEKKPSSKGSPSKVDVFMGFLARIGITVEVADRLLTKLHLTWVKKVVPRTIGHRMPRKQLDWKKTKAYCPSPNIGVRINMKGRESEGIVDPGYEYRELRKQIIKRLRELRTPDGKLVFEAVLPREECFSGAYVDQAPDILLVPNDRTRNIYFRSFGKVFRPSSEYDHRMDGLFAAAGLGITKTGYLPTKLNIVDVAPTVLHLMDLPIPRTIDGRVLTEILDEHSEPANRSVKYQEDQEKEMVNTRIRKLKGRNRI